MQLLAGGHYHYAGSGDMSIPSVQHLSRASEKFGASDRIRRGAAEPLARPSTAGAVTCPLATSLVRRIAAAARCWHS